MSRRKETRLPALTNLEAIKEALDVRLGRRGDPMDRALTMRDIIEGGFPVKAVRRSGPNDFWLEYEAPPERFVPPAPTGLTALPIFGGIHVLWDVARDLGSRVVTEISRSTSSDPETRQVLTYAGGTSYLDMIDGEDQTEYFYWVRFLSNSDHYGPYAGPVSATTEPLVSDVMDRLTGQIDKSHLAESLKVPIDRIAVHDTLLTGGTSVSNSVNRRIQDARTAAQQHAETFTTAKISQEQSARQTQFDSIVTMIDALEAGLDGDYSAGLLLERDARIAGDQALASDLSVVQAQAQENLGMVTDLTRVVADNYEVLVERDELLLALTSTNNAAAASMIRIEETVRATEDEALAQRITTLAAEVDDNAAAIVEEQTARVDGDSALAQQITTLAAEVDDNAAAIVEEQTARIDADGALAQQITTLAATVEDDVQAAIQTEATARADADEALAQQITTVQAALGDDIASVQQVAQAGVDSVTGTLNAMWGARVDANGLIGGFGLGTDGQTVDAFFDVDRFAVGRTNEGKAKPFIIDEGLTYIDTAMIRDASIQEGQIGPITVGKLRKNDGTPITTAAGLLRADAIDVNNLYVQEAARFTGDVFSDNYLSGVRGWVIRQNGYVEFNEAMIRGNLEVQSITVNGEAPFGAASITAGTYNSTTSSSSKTTPLTRSRAATRDKTIYIGAMAAGSRVRLTVQLRDFSVATTGYWTYWYRTNPQTDATPERVDGAARHTSSRNMRVRIWIDGSLKLDRSTSTSWGGNEQIEHVYPSYRSNSSIRVRAEVSASITRTSPTGLPYNHWDKSGPYLSASAYIPNLLVSGDVFRLG